MCSYSLIGISLEALNLGLLISYEKRMLDERLKELNNYNCLNILSDITLDNLEINKEVLKLLVFISLSDDKLVSNFVKYNFELLSTLVNHFKETQSFDEINSIVMIMSNFSISVPKLMNFLVEEYFADFIIKKLFYFNLIDKRNILHFLYILSFRTLEHETTLSIESLKDLVFQPAIRLILHNSLKYEEGEQALLLIKYLFENTSFGCDYLIYNQEFYYRCLQITEKTNYSTLNKNIISWVDSLQHC